MKVLLRSDYAWHEAKWNTVTNCFNVDGNIESINSINIVSIKDDDRNKYVKCKNCGETVLNTPSAIKKHYELSKSSAACLTCKSCRRRDTTTVSEKLTENDDGSYSITTKTNARLECRHSYWNYHDINSQEARKICKYHDCEASGMDTYKDIFSKYPGIFDDILTIDVLIKKKWELISRENDGYCTFKIPISFNLYAVTTPHGFIDYFYYKYRNSHFQFRYSPKYTKAIWLKWSDYQELRPIEISDTTFEKITKKVIELYKEADKDE
jgi:hypothetical protein